MVLNGKENYPKWSQKIKHTPIFNDLSYDIFQEENDFQPTKPTTNKEFAICKNKNKKTYTLIATLVSEEVSHHIISIRNYYGDLKKLKDLYDSLRIGAHSIFDEVLQPIVEG